MRCIIPLFEPLSKLLVSPLIAPIVGPYIIPYIIPHKRSLDCSSFGLFPMNLLDGTYQVPPLELGCSHTRPLKLSSMRTNTFCQLSQDLECQSHAVQNFHINWKNLSHVKLTKSSPDSFLLSAFNFFREGLQTYPHRENCLVSLSDAPLPAPLAPCYLCGLKATLPLASNA